MTVRHTIVFTGTVQGVGFRATCRAIAARQGIVGWVRNEPDGSVRCVAEGERGQLERFVAAVREAMVPYVSDVQIAEAPAASEFRSFTIE